MTLQSDNYDGSGEPRRSTYSDPAGCGHRTLSAHVAYVASLPVLTRMGPGPRNVEWDRAEDRILADAPRPTAPNVPTCGAVCRHYSIRCTLDDGHTGDHANSDAQWPLGDPDDESVA